MECRIKTWIYAHGNTAIWICIMYTVHVWQINIPRYERSLLSQLRYGILQLELETGRYKGNERAQRLCRICNNGSVEDQYHFILNCPAYNIRRGIFIEKVKERIDNWDNLDETNKFICLFNKQPRLLGKFVRDIFLYRKSLIYKWCTVVMLYAVILYSMFICCFTVNYSLLIDFMTCHDFHSV